MKSRASATGTRDPSRPDAGGSPSRIRRHAAALASRLASALPTLGRFVATAAALTALFVAGRATEAAPRGFDRMTLAEAAAHLAEGRPPAEVPVATSDAGIAPTSPPTDAGVVLDLNSASTDELRSLPGVGPKKAQAIVALRASRGGFSRVEELLRVRGIGRKTLARFRERLRCGPRPSGGALKDAGSPRDAGAR